MRDHSATAQVGALQVRIDNLVPQFFGDVFNSLAPKSATASGIVHQNVQGAVGRQALLDDLGHLPGMRHVCWHAYYLVSLPGERRSRTGEFVRLAVRDDELCASPC